MPAVVIAVFNNGTWKSTQRPTTEYENSQLVAHDQQRTFTV